MSNVKYTNHDALEAMALRYKTARRQAEDASARKMSHSYMRAVTEYSTIRSCIEGLLLERKCREQPNVPVEHPTKEEVDAAIEEAYRRQQP